MELPRKISKSHRKILLFLEQNPRSTCTKIAEGCDIPLKTVYGAKYILEKKNYIESNHHYELQLAKEGKELIKHIDDIPEGANYGRIKKTPTKPTKKALEPEPISTNISATADTLANNVTALITENAQLRTLLTKINLLITQSLNIEDIHNEPDSSQH